MVFLLYLLNCLFLGAEIFDLWATFGIEFELVRFLSLHILNCLFQMELSINRFTFLGGGGVGLGGPQRGTNRYVQLPINNYY